MKLFCQFDVDGHVVILDHLESVPKREEYSTLFPGANCITLSRFWRGDAAATEERSVHELNQVKRYDHVAYNLPKNCEGAPHYTEEGRPAFETRRQIDEFCSRLNGQSGAKRKAGWD